MVVVLLQLDRDRAAGGILPCDGGGLPSGHVERASLDVDSILLCQRQRRKQGDRSSPEAHVDGVGVSSRAEFRSSGAEVSAGLNSNLKCAYGLRTGKKS